MINIQVDFFTPLFLKQVPGSERTETASKSFKNESKYEIKTLPVVLVHLLIDSVNESQLDDFSFDDSVVDTDKELFEKTVEQEFS